MKKGQKQDRRFSLLRFLLIISLKDIFKAECARKYILGDSNIGEDIREFEEWRYRRYCNERGIRLTGRVKASPKQPSEQ